jgi:fructose-1,6-bisphosphatase/inositol monophosphatase family enzyme
VLGVVRGPALGVTYAAHGPGTATRQKTGGPAEPIRARSPPPDGLVVIHSRSHENSRRLAEFLQNYRVRERVKCGSALKFGVIAAGEADLYPRFGTTIEWDTAAGQAILAAAGGRVETASGTPPYLRQGSRPSSWWRFGTGAEAQKGIAAGGKDVCGRSGGSGRDRRHGGLCCGRSAAIKPCAFGAPLRGCGA